MLAGILSMSGDTEREHAQAHEQSAQVSSASSPPPCRDPDNLLECLQDRNGLETGDSNWANSDTLDDHFDRHGADFGAKTPDEYARLAHEFFVRGRSEGLPTKVDPSNGTIRIYDPQTNTFGSYSPDGLTKTFFKPTSPSYWDRQVGTE